MQTRKYRQKQRKHAPSAFNLDLVDRLFVGAALCPTMVKFPGRSQNFQIIYAPHLSPRCPCVKMLYWITAMPPSPLQESKVKCAQWHRSLKIFIILSAWLFRHNFRQHGSTETNILACIITVAPSNPDRTEEFGHFGFTNPYFTEANQRRPHGRPLNRNECPVLIEMPLVWA